MRWLIALALVVGLSTELRAQNSSTTCLTLPGAGGAVWTNCETTRGPTFLPPPPLYVPPPLPAGCSLDAMGKLECPR